MTVQKISRSERYMLRGSLKKNGFERWRLVMNGCSDTTGEERAFLIEFYIVNPALSPKECVLGFKSRPLSSEDALHSALAGTQAAQDIAAEKFVQPSFVMVKGAMLAEGGKQMNACFAPGELETDHDNVVLKVGISDADSCVLTTNSCSGAVTVTSRDLTQRPELLCQTGRMTWNLRYKKLLGFSPEYRGNGIHWASFGAKVLFEGSISFDGEDFTVQPQKSFGYIDKNWGKEFANPFFHLSSSNCTSIINGKNLTSSCLAVQGVYNERLSVLVSLEGMNVEFHAGKRKKYTIAYECNEVPEDEDGVRLHWSVSVNDRRHVVDIDVYCNTRALFLRDYESPEGNRKVLRVLGGGNGTGEVRVYRKIRKNLELLEHVHVGNVICEYGNIELPTI